MVSYSRDNVDLAQVCAAPWRYRATFSAWRCPCERTNGASIFRFATILVEHLVDRSLVGRRPQPDAEGRSTVALSACFLRVRGIATMTQAASFLRSATISSNTRSTAVWFGSPQAVVAPRRTKAVTWGVLGATQPVTVGEVIAMTNATIQPEHLSITG